MQDELKKQYEELFDDWKIELALGRIRVMGFPKSDWPDLMQELAMVMLEFSYDPAKANGATEETALFAVVSRRLLHLLRTRYRENARLKRYAQMYGPDDEAVEYPYHPTNTVTAEDIAEACKGLSEFDRQVCSALAAGTIRAQIARDLDCDWHTVDNAIGRIRQALVDAGLKGRVQE